MGKKGPFSVPQGTRLGRVEEGMGPRQSQCSASGILTCGPRWGQETPAFLKCPPQHRPRFPGPTPFPSHLSAQKNFSWIRSILKRFRPSHKQCVYCMYISSPLPQEPAPVTSLPSRNSSLFSSKNQSANFTPFTPTPPRFHLPNKYYTSVIP